MKVSKQQLNNIIKEELAILLKEEELDEGFLDRLLGRKSKLPKPKASGQVAADVSRFSFGPSTEKKPDEQNWIDVDLSDEEEKQKEEEPEVVAVGAGTTEPSYTSSTIPSAQPYVTTTQMPVSDTTTSSTELPQAQKQTQASDQQDLFADYLPREKEKQQLKQKWEKEYQDALRLPPGKAIAALQAISNNTEADLEIRKKASDYVARVLKENNSSSYNKLYENWKRFAKG